MSARRELAKPARGPSVPPRNVRKPGARPSLPGAPRAASRPPGIPLSRRIAASFSAVRDGVTKLRRPAWIAARVGIVAASIAAAVAVGRLAERHVRTSPAFATRTVDVAGNARLSRDEVLRTAGLAVGQNVFTVGPEDAEARLLAHPWIVEAQVHRKLPGSFDVHVRERRPVAVLSLGALYLVSDDATVFKRVGEGDPVDLPVITGVDRQRFTSDRAFRTSLLLELVALLSDYRGAGLYRREAISEVHVDEHDSVSLVIGDDSTLVRLGRGPYRKKLGRLREIVEELSARRARAAYVYLDNVRRPDRATVRIR